MFRSNVIYALLYLAILNHNSFSEILKTLNSHFPEPEGFFGWALASAGDVDADGVTDFIIGAHQEDAGAANAGRAYVYRGSNFALLHILQASKPHAGGLFGSAVAGVGDVNGDGYDDLLVGEYGEDGGAFDVGRAYVFSGYDGHIIHDLKSPNPETQGNFGYGIAGAGDVNNDGFPDLIIGAYGEDGGTYSAGRAYVFDGNSGALIHTLESLSPEMNAYFGVTVIGIGDITDDGCAEFAVGAVYEGGGAQDAGRVYVFDGLSGTVVYTLESPNAELTGAFGHDVCKLDDVDNDGYSDIVIGAWLEDNIERHAGRVYVFSGKHGDFLYEMVSPNPDWFGGFGFTVSDIGDMDDDGIHDIVIGTYKEDGGAFNAGRAYVFSCTTGSLLATLESPYPIESGRFGNNVAGIGDKNGDGRGDVLVGAHLEHGGSSQAGRAYIYSPVVNLQSGSTGSEIILTWSPWPGTAEYWIYGADNAAYFAPGLSFPYQYRLVVVDPECTTWSSSAGILDPENNLTYLIVATDTMSRLIARSNRAGEFDLELSIQ